MLATSSVAPVLEHGMLSLCSNDEVTSFMSESNLLLCRDSEQPEGRQILSLDCVHRQQAAGIVLRGAYSFMSSLYTA